MLAEACRRALAIDPRRAEIAGLIGRLHYEAREWREAVAYLRQAAGAAIPEDVILFLDPREYREIPADFLALSLHHLGEHEEAVRWGELAVAWSGRAGTDRLRDNAWWYRRRARRLWFFALGQTPEPVYGSMLERIGAGGVETTYIELPKALQALGQECFVFCRGASTSTWSTGCVSCRGSAWRSTADLNPDVLVTSRWLDPLYWPALAGAKKILWLQDAYFADPGRAFEVVDRVVVSSPWHRDYTVQRYGHGIDAGKLRVINLGIRRELFAWRRELEHGGRPTRCRRCIRAIPIGVSRSLPRCGRRSSLRFSVRPWAAVGRDVWLGRACGPGTASPAWQERCDQVEAEVKGRFAGHDVIFTGPAEQAGAGGRADAVRCLPVSLQLLRDLLSDRAGVSGGGRADGDVGVWGVGDHVGGWRRREDPRASEFAGISPAVRAGGGGRAAGR